MVLPLEAGVVGGVEIEEKKLAGEGQGAENKIQSPGGLDF